MSKINKTSNGNDVFQPQRAMDLPAYCDPAHSLFPVFGRRIVELRRVPVICYEQVAQRIASQEVVVCLEPHSDDIAFCAGGYLHALYTTGVRIHITNVFGITPPRKSPWHQEFNFDQETYTYIRELEDRAAFTQLYNCHIEFVGLQASAFRGYRTFCQTPKKDDSAREAIAERLLDLKLRYPNARILAPAAIGNHVDHVLIRDMALEYVRDNVLLYEDYPYCTDLKYYTSGVIKLTRLGAVPLLKAIDILPRIRLMNLYHSQLAIPYRDAASLAKRHFGNVSKAGGYHERYWRIQER